MSDIMKPAMVANNTTIESFARCGFVILASPSNTLSLISLFELSSQATPSSSPPIRPFSAVSCCFSLLWWLRQLLVATIAALAGQDNSFSTPSK
jgi:hypothetical protein